VVVVAVVLLKLCCKINNFVTTISQ